MWKKKMSLETKIEIIRLADEGWIKKCELANKFGIRVSSLATVLENKSDLLKNM